MVAGPAGASTLISGLRQPDLAPATLNMWTNHPEWIQQVNSIVGEFEKQYPTIKVQVVPKPGPPTRRF